MARFRRETKERRIDLKERDKHTYRHTDRQTYRQSQRQKTLKK